MTRASPESGKPLSAMTRQGNGDRLGEAQGMRFVHFYFGVAHGLVSHDQIKNFLSQAFEQGEAIALHVGDDRLGDGADSSAHARYR